MKRLLVLSLVIIVILCLALPTFSCKASEEALETAEETTAAASEETKAAEPKTIVWWTLFNENETYADVFKEWIADYKEIHPEITIDIQWAGRDNISKVMAARGAGEVIDIIDQGISGMVPIIQEGETLIVNDYLNTPNYENTGTWLDSFIPGINENFADSEGNMSAVAYATYSYGIFYDKKLWRDNGWVAPKTWDELLAVCENIKNNSDIAPITLDPVDSYIVMWYWNLLVRMGGIGTLYDAYSDETGEKWGEPIYLQAAEMEQELLDKGYIIDGFTGFTWPEGQKRLATREGAMIICASWLINELRDIVPEDFEWGFFAVPEVAGGAGKSTDTPIWPLGWIIFKDSEVAPEAIDFLKFCTNVDNSQKLAEAAIMISCIKEAGTNPLLEDMKNIFDDPNVTTFLTEDGLPGDYTTAPFFKNHYEFFTGGSSPEGFIEKMKADTKTFWENK